MEPLAVIEHLDILRNRRACFRMMLETLMTSQLVLQRTEEAFDRRIVVTIALATHLGMTPRRSSIR
jgi:hypothetical protein